MTLVLKRPTDSKLVLKRPTGSKLVCAKSFTWNETVWDPSMIQTALWLDAADASTITQSGGAIKTWADKSGKRSNASAFGNPTYSATGSSTNKPAVQLDGTGDYLLAAIPSLPSFTSLDVFMAVQTTAAAAADTDTARFWFFGNFDAPFRNTGWFAFTGRLSGEYIAMSRETGVTGGRLGSSTYRRNANTLQILNTRNSSTGSSFFVNGTAGTLNLSEAITTSTDSSPSSTGYTADSNLVIGATYNSISGPGYVASAAIKYCEIIACSSIQSAASRERIEGYLAHKWGLTANLPSNHPYKTVGPTP